MQTETLPYSASLDTKAVLNRLHLLREMSEEEWIEKHGSGTLRKNKSLSMRHRNQYLHERVAWEFGYGFDIMASSRITFNDAITEGDCKPITECGWHAARIITRRIFEEDFYQAKYIIAEENNYKRREGVGLILRTTTASWIPSGYLVFSIIAEYDPKTHDFLPAINPC
jgi:hypothetical protein